MRKSLSKLAFALLFGSVILTAACGRKRDAATSDINGLWDAVVTINGVDIPFRYEIAQKGGQVQGFFFEGDQRVGSSSGSLSADGVLKIEYEHLNSSLDAHIEGAELFGSYRSWGGSPIPFHARRFTPVQSMANPPQVAGEWIMERVPIQQQKPSDTRSWKLFLRQSGAEVTGSILRVDGDSGTLSGQWTNNMLILSHFAGERPIHLKAQIHNDGTLVFILDGTASYIAARSTEARAKGIPDPPDPSRYTSVKDPTTPFHFTGLDMEGKTVSDADPRFKGKVVLLAIGGTWCPNCHDEAPFLVELYDKFHAQGLEIVGLSFEADADPKLAQPHMQTFIRRYKIQYPLLLMGDTRDVAAKLPQMVNFGAFPTSVYLGRDGRVRSVHAGFASEATGQEHTRLKRELTEIIERLLAEKG